MLEIRRIWKERQFKLPHDCLLCRARFQDRDNSIGGDSDGVVWNSRRNDNRRRQAIPITNAQDEFALVVDKQRSIAGVSVTIRERIVRFDFEESAPLNGDIERAIASQPG